MKYVISCLNLDKNGRLLGQERPILVKCKSTKILAIILQMGHNKQKKEKEMGFLFCCFNYEYGI